MRSGTVENLHDFKGKLDKIKELKFFKKIYAETLDKCENILPQEITLTCGEKCEDDSEGDVNSERRCNFLCQWFCVKNDYLIKELAALKEYLNRNTNNYFKSEIQIKIKCNGKTNIDARQFEILTD